MKVDVIALPKDITPEQIAGRSVVVFDVLRATTTMATALAAGAAEVRVFDSIDAASLAARDYAASDRLLCGEMKCLAPPGFDLGNSPRDYSAQRVAGKTIFLSTTNGTRAIVAARGAARLFAAALVNASATGAALRLIGNDVTLLCAGTNGQFADEDMIGAGAVADSMMKGNGIDAGAVAKQAIELFDAARESLPQRLRKTLGGENIIAAKLEEDIDFAARLDVLDIVVEVTGHPPIARRMIEL